MPRLRALALVLVTTGACGQIFGLDQPVALSRDAGSDAVPDVALDAARACPSTYTGRYRFNETRARWLDAVVDCADDADATPPYTHLVVLGDDAERLALLPMRAPNNDAYWIGLTDIQTTGTWIWVTSEPTAGYPPATGAPWSAGQPMSGADCAELVGPMNGVGVDGELLADYCKSPATVALPYICECDNYADDPSRH